MVNNISDLQEIRKNNGRKLLSEYASKKEFAEAAGIAPAQVSGLFGPNAALKVGDKIARRLERECFKPKGWMDIDHDCEPVSTIKTDVAAKCMVAFIEVLQEHGTSIDQMDPNRIYHFLERMFASAEGQKTINRGYVQYMLFMHQMSELKKN